MTFKTWLEDDRLDESTGDWLRATALVGSMAAAAPAYNYLSQEPPRPKVQFKNLDQPAEQLSKTDKIKQLAKEKFDVPDHRILVVKAEDYLKHLWGDKWREVAAGAAGKDGRRGHMPDLTKLGEPVVVVLKDLQGVAGSCQYLKMGGETVKVCTISPWAWGHTTTAREELTHALQGVQYEDEAGLIYSHDDIANAAFMRSLARKNPDAAEALLNSCLYASRPHEFVAKLAELKRMHYAETGEVSNNAQRLLDYLLAKGGPEKLPNSLRPIYNLYRLMRDSKSPAIRKMIDFGNESLQGLVKAPSARPVA